jgi:hypothetical protein
MPTNTKHVVRLAQQQALASFSKLVENMLAETDGLISSAARTAPITETATLEAARYWIANSGREFRANMLAKFTGYLERAMQTMHTDLRAGLHNFRADDLTLVEDTVMTRQVELDRLVLRLRDVDQISLGRINLTIANLHGVSTVLERENPFRPYLAARALYETVREMVRDASVSKVLFDNMAGAMAHQLPGYYAAILAHFEARGLNARLLAQPAEMTHADRERVRGQFAGMSPHHAHGLQELVLKVLDERKADRLPRNAAGSAPRLDAQLKQLQQRRAGAEADQAPLALTEQIGDKADVPDRLTIDLIGLVFEYILQDELLPPAIRQQLARLHLPFLRAAVLEPFLLHEADHPARSFLDRIGTVAAGMRQEDVGSEAISKEVTRLIDQVLGGFDQDAAIFSAAERELDHFVGDLVRNSDPAYGALVDVIDAEASGAQLAAVQKALAALLAPLKPDPRIAEFINTVWIEVMLCQRDGDGGGDTDLLPELIWSAQEKATPADRAALMRTLPDLVRRVREGLDLLGMSPPESKAALDQLVAVHMDVLGKRIAAGAPSMGLDWLRLHFAQFTAAGAQTDSAPVARAELEAALAARGLRATLYSEPVSHAPLPVDGEWLMRARPGAGFEAMVDASFVAVRLVAVSAHHAAFVFSMPEAAPPLVYKKAALLAAMHGGTLRPVEYAPLFERAVGSVMAGAGARALA